MLYKRELKASPNQGMPIPRIEYCEQSRAQLRSVQAHAHHKPDISPKERDREKVHRQEKQVIEARDSYVL
jgi:hypothetical protein